MKCRALLVLSFPVVAIALVLFNDASCADENKDLEKVAARSDNLEKWANADIATLKQLLSTQLERKHLKQAKVLAYLVGTEVEPLEWLSAHEKMDRVLKALDNADLVEARKLASNVVAAKSPGKSIDLTKHFFAGGDWNRDLVMHLFKTTRAGGLGIEVKIKGWVAGGVRLAELDAVAETTHKVSVIGSALEKMAPPLAKMRQKPQWQKLAKDLQEASAEAIAASGKKDARAAGAALVKVDAACVNCHTVFK